MVVNESFRLETSTSRDESTVRQFLNMDMTISKRGITLEPLWWASQGICHEHYTYDVYTLYRTVESSRGRFGDQTDGRLTSLWYKISVYLFVDWLMLLLWLTTPYLISHLKYVVLCVLCIVDRLHMRCQSDWYDRWATEIRFSNEPGR